MSKRKSNLTEDRTSFKPFNYPFAYDAWLKHEQSHWLHTEVPMAEDVKDWKNKLSKEEKQAAAAERRRVAEEKAWLKRKKPKKNARSVSRKNKPSVKKLR